MVCRGAAVLVGAPRQAVMADMPDPRSPRPPSCPDRRLPGVHAQMLSRRAPLGVPLVRVLAGTPDSAGKARRLARDFLGEGHPDADTVALIVSELVTNAVTHSRSGAAGGSVTISLCGGDAGVLVQVRDDGGPSGRWVSSAPGTAAEHGYGLLLVDALADSWGTSSGPHGRVTWCRVKGQSRVPGQNRSS
jgi:anti-sigma regulatory factor (Ser/Thr protein kinase)